MLANVYNARYGYRFVADLSIYIERDLRGSGIGSTLLPVLISLAKPLGFHKLVLTTFTHTPAGVKLYQKRLPSCRRLQRAGLTQWCLD